MIQVGDILVSDDIREKEFVCNLEKCKGACCVEGDYGAPLENEELELLKETYPKIKEYLTPEGIQAIENQGAYILDPDGDYSTPTIGGKECAYAIYDDKGILKCGIEHAWKAGKTESRKPISCHLYPIRVSKYEDFEAVNYARWDICKAACRLGKEHKVAVYEFLKEPLVRKYGDEFYEELDAAAQYLKEGKEK